MKPDIGVCTHIRAAGHTCAYLKETLVLVFVLVPGVNFLLNVSPSYLFIYLSFFFFAF